MDMWPDVAVLIPTFNRAQIVKRTVELLVANLRYSGDVNIFVGCDGDDDTPYVLRELEMPDDRSVVVDATPSGGIGANTNRLIQLAKATGHEFFIGMDDDHHLIAPLCLDAHVRKLMIDVSAGWIHLLMEAKGDEHYDRYKFTASLDSDHYWRVHWDCAERFVMSFRPHLFHARWLEVFSYLPEGLRTGQTEWEYSGHCKEIGMNGGGVNALVPLVAHDGATWHHNNGGNSWNRRGL